MTQERVNILAEICAEIERAKVHTEQFRSLHEAYAVILEEVEEVWSITAQKRKERDPDSLRKELIQVAAMAVKAIESMPNLVGGSV